MRCTVNEHLEDCPDCKRIERPPPVLTKKDFVKRYQANEFGNRSPTWDSVREWNDKAPLDSSARYHLRSKVAWKPTFYNLRESEMLAKAVLGGTADYYVSAMCPHEYNLIQGELYRTTEGIYLNYSLVVGKPMREALAEQSLHAEGIMSLLLLRRYLCPNSYEWLQVLLDRYEDHVIELTALSKDWGTIPGYNTLFWEVRKY